jgi:hypothetical protein
VLERVHRSRIDVEIGVEFLHDNPQTASSEKVTEAGRRQALTERGNHATGDKDLLGRDNVSS